MFTIWLVIPARAGRIDDRSAVVHVENYAGISAREMAAVLAEVEAIFRSAESPIQWAPPLLTSIDRAPRDGSCHLAVVILNVNGPFGSSWDGNADVLGRAAPVHARAWVFANRIKELSADGRVGFTVLLARALAHELGHLLLRSTTHSHAGIMRSQLAAERAGLYTFTVEEAAAMRKAIVTCGL